MKKYRCVREILLGLTLVCAVLASHAQPEEEQDQILRIGIAGEPSTLDPQKYFTNVEEHILKDLFLGLTTMSASGDIVPGAARSWRVSKDGLKWTFKLDRRAKWSDGESLTANDFVFAMRRLQDPKTAASLSFFLYSIKNAKAINNGELDPSELGVRAANKTTLEIELEQPFPFLPERLLYPIAYPLPQHVLAEHGDDWVKPENWVSNGAYTLVDWRSQEYVELVKNDEFTDAKDVQIERARYIPVVEGITGFNRYVAGELHTISDYPRALTKVLELDRPDEVKNSLLQSIMYLVFNMNKPKFADIRVRRALALALDKPKLTNAIFRTGEIPSNTLSPAIVNGYASTGPEEATDPELAKELLTEAGYTPENPLTITLRYLTGNENKQYFVALASMWSEIGVQVELHHSDLAVHFGDLQAGDFEIGQAGWFGENNPEHYIELLWSKVGPANYGQYASSKFDEVFEQARATADEEHRLALLAMAEDFALTDYPVIPLYVVLVRNLVVQRLGGWETNGRNLHPLRYLYWK